MEHPSSKEKNYFELFCRKIHYGWKTTSIIVAALQFVSLNFKINKWRKSGGCYYHDNCWCFKLERGAADYSACSEVASWLHETKLSLLSNLVAYVCRSNGCCIGLIIIVSVNIDVAPQSHSPTCMNPPHTNPITLIQWLTLISLLLMLMDKEELGAILLFQPTFGSNQDAFKGEQTIAKVWWLDGVSEWRWAIRIGSGFS